MGSLIDELQRREGARAEAEELRGRIASWLRVWPGSRSGCRGW